MATANEDACGICTHEFDTGNRLSVALPCGHNFCSSCLIRLRVSGKQKCPKCRYDWAEMDVRAFPGMKALAPTLFSDQEEEEDGGKKKGIYDRCDKHSMPNDFWANELNEFFCRKCSKENRHVDIELIEEAILQIRAALAIDAPEAKKKIEKDLELLDELHDTFVRKRDCVKSFMKKMETVDNDFTQTIEEIVILRSEVSNTARDMVKMQKKIQDIETLADITMAVECKSTLRSYMMPLHFPATDLLQTLLCNIVCCYEEEATTASSLSATSFVNALMIDRSDLSGTKTVDSTTFSFKFPANNESLQTLFTGRPVNKPNDVNISATLSPRASSRNQSVQALFTTVPSVRLISAAPSSGNQPVQALPSGIPAVKPLPAVSSSSNEPVQAVFSGIPSVRQLPAVSSSSNQPVQALFTDIPSVRPLSDARSSSNQPVQALFTTVPSVTPFSAAPSSGYQPVQALFSGIPSVRQLPAVSFSSNQPVQALFTDIPSVRPHFVARSSINQPVQALFTDIPSVTPLAAAPSSNNQHMLSSSTTPKHSLDTLRSVQKLQTGPPWNSDPKNLETLCAAQELEEGLPWNVNNNNFEDALLALARRQPCHLSLLAMDDARAALPVAALIKGSKRCSLTVCFLDSFYQVSNQETDNERLELITAKQSLRLLEFFGHLDHSAISQLPHTLCAVGLAIGSAADAVAVSGLRPWDRLAFLCEWGRVGELSCVY